MNQQIDRLESRDRSGVALIVVLGFLSIMVMMAVAFLTQARVERMVANISADAHRGRQMARTALNAAMSDFSFQLYKKNKLMLPPKGSDFDLFLSSKKNSSGEAQGGRDALADDGLELMKGEARNWIPRRYLEDEDYAMLNTHWMLVRQDPSKGANKDNPIVGRYAYVCFDMSGGIDANLIALDDGVRMVGNATNRASVRSVGMGELKEMEPIADLESKPPAEGKFKELRRGWRGFDTLAELILLTNGRYNGGENTTAVKYNSTDYYYIDEGVSAEELPPSEVWGPPRGGSRWREDSDGDWTRIEKGWPALNPTNVSDLVPYSLATIRGWQYDYNSAKWKTDGLMAWDEHAVWDKAKWETALGELKNQYPGDQIPDWFEEALGDYTGTLAYPNGTNYPSPKNVPMINEVGIKITPTINGSTPNSLDVDIELEVEWWFPFPADDNKRDADYTLDTTICIGASGNPSANVYIPMRGVGNEYSIPSTTLSPVNSKIFKASYNDGKPRVEVLNYSVQAIPVTMNGTNPTLVASMPIQIGMTTNSGIVITTDGGHVVDWMPAGVLNLRRDANAILSLDSADPDYAKTYYYEAFDPRLNHLQEDGWELGPENGSPGEVNFASFSRDYGKNGDSTNFYCKNAPMTSPVEVGYISTGKPWKTVEFCSREGADALARMVSRKIIEGINKVGVAYTNGTINPNTSSTNVLRAAFAGLKVKDDESSLEDADLNEFIQIIGSITESKEIRDNSNADAFEGAFMRGVDWIWMDQFQPDGIIGKKWSKNARHRLIERTWGLFNPNNSMFTVLAIGQSIREGPEQPGKWSADDMVMGERRAVALVWRDPTPPGLGKPHEMFMRAFKFLDE